MKKIIQVHIFRGGNQFVAECLDLPVVTQEKTLDELAQNLRNRLLSSWRVKTSPTLAWLTILPFWRALNLSRWRMPKLKVLSEIQSSVSNSSGVIPASRIMLANSFGWRIFWAWNGTVTRFPVSSF